MKKRATPLRGVALGVGVVLLFSCTNEPATGPALETAAIASTIGDSASRFSIAAATAPGDKYAIPISAGESIQITVLDSECTGAPETVQIVGVFSQTVASGTCNYEGSLNGQTVTLGPATASGSVSFFATHQVFGAGAIAPISGPNDGDVYIGYLDDGATCCDYNDVIISVTVMTPNPRIDCTSPVQRGSGVECSIRGSGVTVSGWRFSGVNSDGSALNVVFTSPVRSWSGTAVASGTVSADVSVGGDPQTLTSSFTVTSRDWKWVKSQHWSYGRTAIDCEPNPYQYGAQVLLGWTVQKGSCVSSPLTPNPQATTGGYTLKEALDGPNAHLWYVSAVTYRMDTESNINSSIKSGNGPFYTLVNNADKTACRKTQLKAPDFFDYNKLCRQLDPVPFINGIWNHEGYGPNNNLAGHQAQLELYALFPEGDPYKSLEPMVNSDQAALNFAVILKAQAVNLYLNQHAADHGVVNGGFCGDTWQWNASSKVFVLAPALGSAGRCL